VGAQGVVGHELIRNLDGEGAIETAAHVDPSQLSSLSLGGSCELAALARQVGALGIGLGADRDILTSGHGKGPGGETSDRSEQNGAPAGSSRCDPDDQTAGRDETIVGTEHGCPEPPDAPASVQLDVPGRRSH
jgi:hypothetical protein